MSKPEITTVLTLSTSHITGQDNGLLEGGVDPMVGTWFPLRYLGENDGVGYMVHVAPEDIEDSDKEGLKDMGYSSAITGIQEYAKSHGCDYIRLDPDGPVVEELDSFEW